MRRIFPIFLIHMKSIPLTLTESDIQQIEVFMQGKQTKREMIRANALLLLHRWKQAHEIADFLTTDYKTIWRTKMKFLSHGVTHALIEKPRSGQPKKYTQKHETELVAIVCSNAQEGRARWTLELLTKTMKEKVWCETINSESVRLMLKKMNVSLG